MIKISDKKYDLKKISEEVEGILDQHNRGKNQVLIQSVDGLSWDGIIPPYLMHDDLRETDYKIPNTPADWELTRYMLENNLCRTRIMILPSRKCYSWHKDVGHRLHLAVKTNDCCFFVENNSLINIPADGYPYLLDVGGYHTAMNCSEDEFDRIHIVGVIR